MLFTEHYYLAQRYNIYLNPWLIILEKNIKNSHGRMQVLTAL